VETYQYAQKYLDMGLQPVPLVPGDKYPMWRGWSTTQYAPMDFMNACNIGLKLGRAGGNLVDVDLDSLAAVELAPQYLPETGLISGRPGKPRSHWFYRSETPETRIHLTGWDGRANKNQTIMELRANGHQSVVPPSLHPKAGGDYFWDSFQDPREILYQELRAAFDKLALALNIRPAPALNIKPAPQVSSKPRPPQGQMPPFRLERKEVSRHLDNRIQGLLHYRSTVRRSIEGDGGGSALMAVALVVVRGFCLTDEAALSYLEFWNRHYADPPWESEDLEAKIADVRDQGRKEWGYLLITSEDERLNPKELALKQWSNPNRDHA
jgi:hypothetical protein